MLSRYGKPKLIAIKLVYMMMPTKQNYSKFGESPSMRHLQVNAFETYIFFKDLPTNQIP